MANRKTDFYISKLQVSGPGVRSAVIPFNEGTNILHGNSDEGKSYVVECLDFMFGAKNMRLQASSGYNTVSLFITTSQGEIRIDRRFDVSAKKSVSIFANDPRFESLTCYEQSYEVLDSFWLRLIGIGENQSVISDTYFNRSPLTWRMLTKLFLIKETRISAEKSIISSDIKILSALILLINGNDFHGYESRESDADRAKQAKGAIAQIKKLMNRTDQRIKAVLEELKPFDAERDESAWSNLLDRFSFEERRMTSAIEESKELHRTIDELTKRVATLKLKRESQKMLQGLYRSQSRRLLFAVEGELLSHSDGPSKAQCPFCGAETESVLDENAIEASQVEMEQAEQTRREIERNDIEIKAMIHQLEEEIDVKKKQCEDIDRKIATAYAPSIEELRLQIDHRISYSRLIAERDNLMVDYATLQNDIDEINSRGKDDGPRFSVKDAIPADFFNEMGSSLYNLLEECGFEELRHASLYRGTMDIDVNGQDKKTYGEGFRAFLNTAVGFTLFKYLCDNAMYKPGVLILDSPTQAMQEKDGSNLIPNIFSYLIAYGGCGQVFIIDNDIPESVKTDGASIFEFGTDGFLPDFKRPIKKPETKNRKAKETKQS